MARILVALVLVALNTGLYLNFVLSERLSLSRNMKLFFYLVFLIVSIAAWVSKDSTISVAQSSTYLLVAYLLVLISFRFLIPAIFDQYPTYQAWSKSLFNYFLLPIATLLVTVGQMLRLFDVS
jgi:hypothetical protein